MKLIIDDEYIPGTNLRKRDMDGATGLAFLHKMFLFSDGVMLSQIRAVSGIDGSTLQNWTKRGWVENSVSKKYNINQVAHILIINMLRGCLQLEKIAFLIQYINGSVSDRSDDIIPDSQLYDYICRILDGLTAKQGVSMSVIDAMIQETIMDYKEPVDGAKKRLYQALQVIVTAYYAATVKHQVDRQLGRLIEEKGAGGHA